jgi:acetylornithine deacetylase/succinyl-diaminopimelate desuccinylase-like protein
MLRYRRPAGSETESNFAARYLAPLARRDAAGNYIRRIGKSPAVLWSSHYDTVHHTGGLQRIVVDGNTVRLHADSTSNCLGADCTAGVWLMREMIFAKKPGLYIFHAAEEIGGIGSRYVADKTPGVLDGIVYAIAFDRAGNGDVITHQSGTRCASNDFADALATALGGLYAPDNGGLFTDTANYVDLIGECTNVSIGYAHAHTARESLDVPHLFGLLDSILTLDTNALPRIRQPGEADPDDWHFNWGYDSDQSPRRCASLASLVRDNADTIADLLADYGFDARELESEILQRGGFVRR